MIRFYNSNPRLKGIGVRIPYTEHQIQEYTRCANDCIYFVKNYCQIVSLDHGLVPFDLYSYQEKFITTLEVNRKVISMQPRQQGKSQTVAAYILWYTLFGDNKTVAILANKGPAAREILSRYQHMYEGLPFWIQSGIKTWNKGDIELENGSIVFTSATSGSGIRGRSVNFLYLDEFAIVPNTIADDFLASTYPTISAGTTTKIVITSTPLGYNHFWKLWKEAEDGDNDFVPLRVQYFEHPNRDDKWAQEQRKLLGDVRYNQEVLCEFLGSSHTLVDPGCIAKLRPIKPIISTNEGLDVYEKPKTGHTYVLIVDPSKGVGGDYSAVSIIDITEFPYSLVSKYRNKNISPLLLPNVIYKLAKDYNNAFVLVETNTTEHVAITLHGDLEYENLLMVNRGSKGQYIGSGFGANRMQYGVITDKKVKRLGCTAFKDLIEQNKLLVTDADTISEISTFIEKKGTYSADDGYHDDLVMTLVLLGWLTTNNFFRDLTNVNLRRELFSQRMVEIEESLTPFGFYDDGTNPDLLNF